MEKDETKEILKLFKSEFNEIKNRGFVRSTRKNNTGIGKTLEDLMKIEENNCKLPDFMEHIEIKSKRLESCSMLTLFTKSPTFPKKANGYLVSTYGYPDEEITDVNVLHTTLNAIEYNSLKGKYGFKLEVDESKKLLYISIKDTIRNIILDDEIYYTYDSLMAGIEKSSVIAFIEAQKKFDSDGVEMFHYTKGTLLYGLTIEKFIDALMAGLIYYDIRIGSYKTGKNKGMPHDRRSGFRIMRRDIPKVFEMESL